jgi:predicted porin
MPAKLLRFSQSSALSAAACLCIAATPAKAEPWRSSVELYGPVPLRLDTTTTVVTQNNRSVTTEAVLNLGQVIDNLQWITAVRGSVEKGRWGVLTDLSYTKLGQEDGATTPNGLLTGRASVNVSQGIYDLAVRYRFGEPEAAVGTAGQFSLIPYAGIRVIDAQMDVAAQVDLGNILSFQRQGNFGRTWAQPLLGTQATVFLSPRLRAFARADIGGFGLSGAQDLSGNAQVGLGYAVGNSTDLNISWRYFGLDYNNGDNPDSGFSSYQNGLEIGLKFFF